MNETNKNLENVKYDIVFDKEYTYKEICSVFGWKATSGEAKQRQINLLENAYEFYHPENKKTHKPKKSYVFTKKLKDIDMVDNRINNGRNNLFSQDAFDYLFGYMLNTSKRYQIYNYQKYDTPNSAYISTDTIYKNFGFDIYELLDTIKFKDDNKEIKRVFKSICIDVVKRYIITRICKKLGLKKNSLPKGIVRDYSVRNKKQVVDNELLVTYNKYEQEALNELGYKDLKEAFEMNNGLQVHKLIIEKFKSDKIYGVKKTNIINFDDAKKIIEYNPKLKREYQNSLRIIIISSIINSILCRVNKVKTYKYNLTEEENIIILGYTKDLLDACYKHMYINECQYKEFLSSIEVVSKQIEEKISEIKYIIDMMM